MRGYDGFGKEMRAWAKDIFSHFGQEFEAYLVHEDDNIFVMDWKDKNGSGNLATRYIVDKKRGTFIITGDSGHCIACWYNPIKVEDLVHYINSTGYFMEKIQCTDHKYTYAPDDIDEDLEDTKQMIVKEKLEDYDGDEENIEYIEWLDEFEEDFMKISEIVTNSTPKRFCTEERFICSENLDDLAEKYWGAPYYEAPWYDAGCRIDKRLYLWTYGYQEGVERLRGEEFVRKDI